MRQISHLSLTKIIKVRDLGLVGGQRGLLPDHVLDEPELTEMAVELMRADLCARDTFRYTPGTPIDVSLTLLDSLHDRWGRLLQSLTPEQWKRTFRHPEMGPMTLEKTLALYAWHGPHHVAHVTELRKRMSW